MPAEAPTPNNMPRKRKPPAPKISSLSEDGWLKGRAHLEAIRMTTCGCGPHEVGAYVCMIHAGVAKEPAMVALFDKYADINLKVHASNREAGWKTPTREAEEILIVENKKSQPDSQ